MAVQRRRRGQALWGDEISGEEMGSWLSDFAKKAKSNVAQALNLQAKAALNKGIPGVTGPVVMAPEPSIAQKAGMNPLVIGGIAAGALILILALRK